MCITASSSHRSTRLRLGTREPDAVATRNMRETTSRTASCLTLIVVLLERVLKTLIQGLPAVVTMHLPHWKLGFDDVFVFFSSSVSATFISSSSLSSINSKAVFSLLTTP